MWSMLARPRVYFLCLTALLVSSLGSARAQTSEEVQFDTPDKVQIHGTFYPGAKPRAPCVILLHKFGGSRKQAGWGDRLVPALRQDFALLSFDFRGHGDSTVVTPEVFWRVPNNLLIRGAARFPSKISYREFPPAYMPVLANDVAAAKRFLDQQNDKGICNSSSVVVIGAEEGAAVGALWVTAAWSQPKLIKSALGQWSYDLNHMDGEDIASGVWLSIPRTLSGISVATFLMGPMHRVRDRVPMVFFYGSRDRKAAETAETFLEEMKRFAREKLDLTRTRGKDTKSAGTDLLQGDLNTVDEIANYLEKVMQRRGVKAPSRRDADNAPAQLIPLSRFGYMLR